MTSTSTSSKPAGNGPRGPKPAGEVQVHTGDPVWNQLPQHTPPPLAAARWHGPGAQDTAPVLLLLHPAALDDIQAHCLSEPDVEMGGVLLGHAYQHEQKVYVEVKAAMPAHTADHGPYHFTFTADAWSGVHRDRAARHPSLDIVGWFHTHPDLGVFYSADDVVVHTAAFTMPWHIGLVVDHWRAQAALFGWQNGEIVPVGGFYELPTPGRETTAENETEQSSAVPWRVMRGTVREDSYEAQLFEEAVGEDGLPYPLPARRTRPGPSWASWTTADWLMALAGGLAIFAGLLLLAGTLIGQNQRANLLEEINQKLIAAQMEDAAAAGLAECHDADVRLLSPLPGERVPAEAEVPIFGRAIERDARTYQVAVQHQDETTWEEIATFRRAVRTGRVAEWDTSLFPVGDYQLRLTARDADGQSLSSCTVSVSVAR